MKKVIISVAPVAADTVSIDPKSLADEVIRASKAGAAMVHLHAKDQNGKLTEDISVLKETFRLIRAGCDIIIEASTGGISDMDIVQRCAPLECGLVEAASLNCGSCNLGENVYHNSFEEIRYCSQKITEKGIVPDFEVFEIGMIHNIRLIAEKIPFREPMLFNIVLGQTGAMPATIEALAAFVNFVPKGALWAATDYGRRDFLLLSAAASMGASLLRVGFEDSVWYEGDEKAKDNVELVERMASIIRSQGMELASAAEARKILGIKRMV